MILFLTGLAWFVAVLIADLQHDWKAQETIDHAKGWKRRALWLIPTGILWVLPGLMSYPPEYWTILWAPLLMISLWLLLFDSFYNLHYSRPLFFIPKLHRNSAITDRLLYPLPVIVRGLVKVGLVTATLIMYFQ